MVNNATKTMAGQEAKMPRVMCEHCGKYVSKNVYSRNHGDKCSYKGAPEGHKKCKACGEYLPVYAFSPVSVITFDGRSATCSSCLSKRYYTPKCA